MHQQQCECETESSSVKQRNDSLLFIGALMHVTLYYFKVWCASGDDITAIVCINSMCLLLVVITCRI